MKGKKKVKKSNMKIFFYLVVHENFEGKMIRILFYMFFHNFNKFSLCFLRTIHLELQQ